MKIGIDARCLCWARGGVARILLNFLQLWPKMSDEHRYVLYFDDDIPKDECLYHPFFSHRVIHKPRFLAKRRAWSGQLLLPLAIRKDNLDLFFAPYYIAPLYCPCPKSVVAAWDISYTTHRSHYPFRQALQLSFLSRNACKNADGIVTCSPYDARQIEKFYGIPESQICTLRLAVDEKFKPQSDSKRIDALRNKYRLPSKYILSMGVILNRRNVDVIINAFKGIQSDHPDFGLVVAGRNSTEPMIDIEGLMKPLIDVGQGAYIPWVPDDELSDFYSGAWYYICTSTVDGEALMLKESMQCGTPIITSPLLEETVEGHAIILEDPTSQDLTSEILRIVINSDKMRQNRADEGLKWMKTLSWHESANDCLQFIENL